MFICNYFMHTMYFLVFHVDINLNVVMSYNFIETSFALVNEPIILFSWNLQRVTYDLQYMYSIFTLLFRSVWILFSTYLYNMYNTRHLLCIYYCVTIDLQWIYYCITMGVVCIFLWLTIVLLWISYGFNIDGL